MATGFNKITLDLTNQKNSSNNWSNNSALFYVKSFNNVLSKFLFKNLLTTYDTFFVKNIYVCDLYVVSTKFSNNGLKRNKINYLSSCTKTYPCFFYQKNKEELLSQMNVSVNKITKKNLYVVKTFFLWEQFFYPGFVILNDFCDWFITADINKNSF